MHGATVFRGTRVPVRTLFDYLEGGDTLDDFLDGFPAVPPRSSIGSARRSQATVAGEWLMRLPILRVR